MDCVELSTEDETVRSDPHAPTVLELEQTRATLPTARQRVVVKVKQFSISYMPSSQGCRWESFFLV